MSKSPTGLALSPEEEAQLSDATSLRLLQEMATLLNTGLTEEQLAASLRMIEAGANPDALASAIQLLRSKGVAK